MRCEKARRYEDATLHTRPRRDEAARFEDPNGRRHVVHLSAVPFAGQRLSHGNFGRDGTSTATGEEFSAVGAVPLHGARAATRSRR